MSRKPADRLAEIREQIKTLEAEEAQLRAGFIAGTLPLGGDDYTVTVETKVNERIDARSMRVNIPEHVWMPYLLATPTTYVSVRRRVAEDPE